MRKLLIGILLFLIWMALSTYYYANNIFPRTQPVQETVQVDDLTDQAVTESSTETLSLPDLPAGIILYFDFDKTAILSSASLQSFLANSLSYMKADTGACLLLTGHTCSIGTEADNIDLSLRRSNSVKQFFLEHGYSSQCIQLSSKGETDPADDNSTEEGRKKNRRVTIRIKPQ
jgi:outer membrane protein OmpA-like peptidoglycan-associated protein